MVAPSLGSVDAKITCPNVTSTFEAEFVAASQAGQEAIYLRETLPILDFLKLKPLFCTKTNLACVEMSIHRVRRKFSRHIDIRRCYVRELVLSGFLKLVLSLCACTKWWLMPSPKACRPRLSSVTARSWLVMLLSVLVYYVASVANI